MSNSNNDESNKDKQAAGYSIKRGPNMMSVLGADPEKESHGRQSSMPADNLGDKSRISGKQAQGTQRIGSRDLPLSEIAELKIIFDQLDGNHSGQVDLKELKKVFISLGLDGRQSSMYEVMDLIDDNNSQNLDFNEFVRFMTSPMITGQHLGNLKKHFKNKMVS